jgi:Uma2 family endonuclease
VALSLTRTPQIRGEWLPMTSEEFDAWVSDGMQAEWVDGRGIIFVTTSARHVRSSRFLKTLLALFCSLTGVGEVLDAPFEMRLRGGRSRREPDIMVVLAVHRDRIGRLWLDGPADFVIEFISRHSAQEDLVRKRREFEAAGVPEYVAIDVRDDRDGVTFLRLGQNATFEDVAPDSRGRFHSTILPGFWIDPAWFRQDPMPAPEAALMELAPEAYLRHIQTVYDEARRRTGE